MALLATLTSCSHLSSQTAYSVRQVLAEKDRLVGRPIVVEGFLRFTPGSRNLWHSRESHKTSEGQADDCISVTNDSSMVTVLMGQNDHMVRLSGTFLREPFEKDEVNLWYCNDWIVAVETVSRLD
jgi:hypothetical protein